MVTLIVEGSGNTELTYQLTKQVISIGASSQNDVIVRSPGVAPKHVVIHNNGEVVTFLGQSRQIVALNGERRSRGVLKPGDRLRIGTATVVVKDVAQTVFASEESRSESKKDAAASESEGSKQSPLPEGPSRHRSEVVLYSEPTRVAEARALLVEIMRSSVHTDLVPSLETFFARFFAGRRAALAVLDGDGALQPVATLWGGEIPRLPPRTFSELGAAGRFALLRMGSVQTLIFPVDSGGDERRAYLLAETSETHREDDEQVLAELARLLAIFRDRVMASDALFGPWEKASRATVEDQLPGSSQAVQALREDVVQAARSPHPVLVCGIPGSGRTWTARLIASLHPTGETPVEVFDAKRGSENELRLALFGSVDGKRLDSVMKRRARGSALVIRDLHALPLPTQQDLARVITEDLEADLGPAMRWMATTSADCLTEVNEGTFDPSLFRLFHHHFLVAPSLDERREDIPLLIIRLLKAAATEQGKEIGGIDLDTLSGLLNHSFDGQTGELLGELRRLVTAAAAKDVISGAVPAVLRAAGAVSVEEPVEASATSLLALDDLKIVVPGVEKMIIDRVLRRTLGNQSKAARQLKLSRGALIAKMKDYDIPDYRYLRRQK